MGMQFLLVVIVVCCLRNRVYGATPVQELFRLHGNEPAADSPRTPTSPANAHLTMKDSAGMGSLDSSTTGPLHALLPPRNLTLVTSGLDPDGKAYAQLAWLPPFAAATGNTVSGTSSSTTILRPPTLLPVDRYRITWHELANPKDEFRKTVDGDTTSYTVEHLTAGIPIVIEIQAFRWVDDKKLRSPKVALTVRTAAKKSSSYDTPTEIARDTSSGIPSSAAVFPLADHNITVNTVFFQNGLLKANLSWSALPVSSFALGTSTSYTPSFVIRWYPKVCLGSERKHGSPEQRLLVKPLLTATNTNSVVVYDLNFNCRYAVAIYQRSQDGTTGNVVERLRGVKHFLTPMCQDVAVAVGSTIPNCPKHLPRLPGPPQNVSCLFLVQTTEITATCSWEAPLNYEQSIIGYRTMYAKKMLDPHGLYGIHPFPVLDRNSLIMKVLDDDEMSFSIAALEEETEYVVHIQAISAAGFGVMTRLEFITPRLIHSVALSQTLSRSRDFLQSAGRPPAANGGRKLLSSSHNCLCFFFFILYKFTLNKHDLSS